MRRSRAKLDLWVGLFVLVAFAVLMWGTLRISGPPEWFQPEVDSFVARFPDASGLSVEGAVLIAGVKVGAIESIALEGRSATVRFYIDAPGVRVPIDSQAVIRSRGLLGERVLEVVPGDSQEMLADGGVLTRTRPAANVDALVDRLSHVAADVEQVSATFRNALGGPEGEETVREIVGNVRVLTTDLREVIRENADRIDNVAVNLDAFSADIAELTAENRDAIGQLVGNLEAATSNLAAALERVVLVMDRVERGEGSLGKLLADDALLEEVDGTLTEARAALREVRRAAEETQEQVPSTILLSIFGSLF